MALELSTRCGKFVLAMLETIMTYLTLSRDELMTYLRPFAERGEVVSEADVRSFFREKENALRARKT